MIVTLKQRPDFFPSVLKLVEKSFGYDSLHKIEIDFFPLFEEENWEQCFILLDESENILAHLGVKFRQMSVGNKTFPIALLGGIAVELQQRGQGHFRNLLNEVIKKIEQHVTFFILWSDKNVLYEKFGFYQVGELFEVRQNRKNHIASSSCILNDLPSSEQSEIAAFYHLVYEGKYACIKRDERDWASIAKMTSVQLMVEKNLKGNILSYAFKGKGMDLQNIIYEWNDNAWLSNCSTDMNTKIWFPMAPTKDFKVLRKLFLGLVKIGNVELFQMFFHSIFKERLNLVIHGISGRIQEHGPENISFQTILEMTFENSSKNKWPVYISGLDSI